MKALGTFALALLILLAACFSYAHRALYQQRFERDLTAEATRVLQSHPEFNRVHVSFTALDARLSGTVALPRNRDEARKLIDALPGARVTETGNGIRIGASLRLEPSAGGGYEASGWIPVAGDWRGRIGAALGAAAPQVRFDLAPLQTHPFAEEPSFVSQPTFADFVRTYFSTVSAGRLALENDHVRMAGRVRGDADRLRLVAMAVRALGPGREVQVENEIELLPRGGDVKSGAPSLPGGSAREPVSAGDLGGILRGCTVYFGAGSSSLEGPELAKVDAAAAAIRRLAPSGRFLVVGRADASGNAAANQRVSQKRAAALANALAARGVPRAQLEVKALVDPAPAPGASPEARRQGRRAEIIPR